MIYEVVNMDKNRIEEGIKLLKENGLKITPQRKAIMKYIATSQSHPTADEIFKSLTNKLPNLTNVTVYNNLKCLKKYGIINELTFGYFSSRYEWKSSHHYHVVCKSCGKICDFNYPRMTDIELYAKKRSGFNITRHLFQIYGACSDCDKKHFL
jgi:Fur family transcriptional regulator, peroxide stress response regulator